MNWNSSFYLPTGVFSHSYRCLSGLVFRLSRESMFCVRESIGLNAALPLRTVKSDRLLGQVNNLLGNDALAIFGIFLELFNLVKVQVAVDIGSH